MDPVLYNTMNGAQMDFNKQGVHANNMANANTTGFKSDLFQAQALFIQGSVDSGESIPVQMDNGTNFSDGPLITTGRDLDIAVRGKGWFAVQDAKGKEAYTRAGDFHVDDTGMLVTAAGQPVIGDGGPISIPPAQRIEIAEDGTISIVPMGGPPGVLAVLDRLKLVRLDPSSMVKGADGLVKLSKGNAAPADASIIVIKGSLEGSNVNSIDQMVNMISTGQEFSAKMKLLEAADNNARKLSQLIQD